MGAIYCLCSLQKELHKCPRVTEEWHLIIAFFFFFLPSLEAAQEPEGQEDYEEESFEFSERENRANNQTLPDMAKRSQMEYYGTYGKGTGRFSNT